MLELLTVYEKAQLMAKVRVSPCMMVSPCIMLRVCVMNRRWVQTQVCEPHFTRPTWSLLARASPPDFLLTLRASSLAGEPRYHAHWNRIVQLQTGNTTAV